MNLKPLGDRVILKQDEAEVTTASGLFLDGENVLILRADDIYAVVE